MLSNMISEASPASVGDGTTLSRIHELVDAVRTEYARRVNDPANAPFGSRLTGVTQLWMRKQLRAALDVVLEAKAPDASVARELLQHFGFSDRTIVRTAVVARVRCSC